MGPRKHFKIRKQVGTSSFFVSVFALMILLCLTTTQCNRPNTPQPIILPNNYYDSTYDYLTDSIFENDWFQLNINDQAYAFQSLVTHASVLLQYENEPEQALYFCDKALNIDINLSVEYNLLLYKTALYLRFASNLLMFTFSNDLNPCIYDLELIVNSGLPPYPPIDTLATPFLNDLKAINHTKRASQELQKELAFVNADYINKNRSRLYIGNRYLAHEAMSYYVINKMPEAGLDFWFGIKNNFSYDNTLLLYQSLCRWMLEDTTCFDNTLFAAHLNRQLSDELLVGLSAYYYHADYDLAIQYYLKLLYQERTPIVLLQLAMSYQLKGEDEADSTQKAINLDLAKRYFQELLEIENQTSQFECAPYAYYYLNQPDKALVSMAFILQKQKDMELFLPPSDSLDFVYYSNYIEAAEIYTLLNKYYQARRFLRKAFTYYCTPTELFITERKPLLSPIHKTVKEIAKKYYSKQDNYSSPIQRDTISCDIPFSKFSTNSTKSLKCTINGIMIDNALFDPGADYVQIPKETTDQMIANGILTSDDFIGQIQLSTFSGKDENYQLISLKSVELGRIKLTNVQAVIAHNDNAPPILGCTVWNNLQIQMPSPNDKRKIHLTYIKESISEPHVIF